MGLVTRLFKNTGYLTIGNQIGNLLQFLFFLYFARRFGEKIVGQYSFAFSYTYLFLSLADLGLSAYMMREIARDSSGNRRIFVSCLSLRFFSIALSSLFAIIIALLFFKNYPNETIKIMAMLGLFQIFFSIADIFIAEFKGHDRMGLVSILNIFFRFLISATGIILIFFGFDFLKVLICFPFGAFIYLILCIYLSFHYFEDAQLVFKGLNLKDLFIEILPFMFTVIFVETFYHQDILILGFLQDNETVGIYAAPQKIILAFLGTLVFVHTALLPTFSRLYIESRSKLVDISKQSLRYLLLIGLPIATGLYAISDKLIVFLFSNSFSQSIDILKILSWTIALGLAAATYSVLLTAINRQTDKVIVIGICLAFNIAFNFVLIPKLSHNGAAISKLMTETLHLIMMAYMVSKYLSPIPICKVVVKPALSSLLMYVFIRFFQHWHLINLIIISPFVYFLSLVIMRAYNKEEIEGLKRFYLKILSNRKPLKAYVSKK